MNDAKEDQNLVFTHKNLKNVSFVFFKGLLIKKNMSVLEEVFEELKGVENLEFVFFDYSKLKKIGSYIDRELVQFQLKLRERGLTIRHCGLEQNVGQELLKVGTLKKEEVKGSLNEAIKELIQ